MGNTSMYLAVTWFAEKKKMNTEFCVFPLPVLAVFENRINSNGVLIFLCYTLVLI
jgi:hypothetical protein